MGYNEIVKKLTKDKFLESYGGKYLKKNEVRER